MIVGVETYPTKLFQTGIRTVVEELLKGLRNEYPQHSFVELMPKYEPLKTTRNGFHLKIFNHLQRVYWTQVTMPLMARKHKCDLLLCTSYFSPYFCSIPTVTIFYDMAVWKHPEWYPALWRAMNKVMAEIPARRNACLTTISEDARADILKHFGLSSDRVRSIYLGAKLPLVATSLDREVLAGYNIQPDDEYILYMGPAIWHKNLTRLVEAVGKLRELMPDRRLLLVIGGPSNNLHGRHNWPEIDEAIARLGLQDSIRKVGFVPREHCTILYRNAAVYAFPSLFEGFGLPMVEAMMTSTCIAAADIGVLREIGADAAVYFNPYDPADMARVMRDLLCDSNRQAALREQGRIRVKSFTWLETARQYMQLFTEIVHANSREVDGENVLR